MPAVHVGQEMSDMAAVSSRSRELRERAVIHLDELSRHPVLARYWGDISVVLKGSTARGNADCYSDVDFVVFCDAARAPEIIAGYSKLALITRTDGIFLPLGDWEGHYNLASYEGLAEYFSAPDFPQAWEYSNTVVMHDPKDAFRGIVELGSAELFSDHLGILKSHYVHSQLTLDWLRHPLRRGDSLSALLHCGEVLRSICRMCYLLAGKPYPHDKWLIHYLPTTEFGRGHAADLMAYGEIAWPGKDLETGLEIGAYPQYSLGAALLAEVADQIRSSYGDQAWLAEWYLHV